MNLNTGDWKEYRIIDLFRVQMGNKLDKNKMTNDNPEINFVSRISYNNGVDTKVDRINDVTPFPAGLLTVSLGGEYLGSCYIQKEEFYTAQNVAVLAPLSSNMSYEAKCFISALIKYECKEKYYAFGRELNTHIGKDFTIKLPSLENNGTTYPNWQFMKDYIKSLHHKPLATKNISGQGSCLSVSEWKEFRLGDLFDIKKGKRLTAEDQTEGTTNYIGAIDSNNGVANHIGQSPIHLENTISLSYNDSVREAFYQNKPYWATDDVNALYPKYTEFNKYIGLFICTVLKMEKYRFSYGRKWTLDSMKDSYIKLPVDMQGDPDWQFMENYIKSLPYGDRI